MGVDPAIDITAEQRKIILTLLNRHLPGTAAWVYGSRAKWTSRPQSDLDLVVFAAPNQRVCVGALRDALEESDLPFRVDLFIWDDIPEAFLEQIERDHVVLVGNRELGTDNAWRETTLGEVIELKRGYDLPKRERIEGSIPIVSSSGTIDHHKHSKVAGPGVVIGRYGTLGKVFFIQEDFWPLNTALYVRDFKGNDPRFIGYFLEGLDVSRYSDKAAVPGLNRNHLHQEIVCIPSDVNEQRAIACILGTLDDKIELNCRENETLEAMARTLFKSWFVDFDPVRAKMEGRDCGLPQHLANLFPDRLVDSELGIIPKNWNVYPLDQLADHHTKSTTPSSFPETEFEHFSIPAYDTDHLPIIERGATIKSNKTIIPSDSILLSKLNPEILRVWMPDASSFGPQVCSTEFLAFTPRAPANRALLYSLFSDDGFQRLLQSMVTGTSKSHQRVSPKALKQRQVLLGTPMLFERFGQCVSTILDSVIRRRAESKLLAGLRDVLLPKLMSGDIRLCDAESMVGAVA